MTHEALDPPAFRAADPAASAVLAEWNARFAAALRAYFRRRGVAAADCDDLTQEVFLRMAGKADLGAVREAERYLLRAAGNVLTDWHRRHGARGQGLHDSLSPDLADSAAGPEQVLLGKEALVRLRAALARMPERTGRIFALHHFEGLKYAEIAVACGIAVRTVEDHMARANQFLLVALERGS